MAKVKREYGVVGLGRMGGNLSLQAMEKGIKVVGFVRKKARPELLQAGLVEIKSYDGFRMNLSSPRVIFVYIPAGPEVDRVLDDIASMLEKGDILVDGGNSYWGDSIRRHRRLKEKGIHLVDLYTSGGVDGARHGACFMAGGEKEAIARIEPMLLELATASGYVHAGPPGVGHFTKLVHNGIEFGMLQAIGGPISCGAAGTAGGSGLSLRRGLPCGWSRNAPDPARGRDLDHRGAELEACPSGSSSSGLPASQDRRRRWCAGPRTRASSRPFQATIEMMERLVSTRIPVQNGINVRHIPAGMQSRSMLLVK